MADDDILEWAEYDSNAHSGEGESGWAEDTVAEDGKRGLREALAAARPHITVHDAETTIESYTPIAGRVFDATDTGREYIGDGTSWNLRRHTGPNPTFESAEVKGPLHSGEVSVGQTGPVTGITGDSGEYVHLGNFYIGLDTSFTNTSYQMVTDATTRAIANFNNYDITGISGYGLSWSGIMGNDSGGTTTCRLILNYNGNRYVEDSYTGGGGNHSHSSEIADITETSGDGVEIDIEGKVSGGKATVRNWIVSLWGKIE